MYTRLLMLSLMVLLGTSQVYAKDSAKEDRAFKLYQQAGELFEVNQFAEAVEKLKQAHTLFPEAIILVKMAEGLEHLGRLEEALEAFAQVESSDEELTKRVRIAVRRLEVALTKRVPVSLDTGTVRGARIFVNGHDKGKVTPAVVEFERGSHHLRIEKEGYYPVERPQFVVQGSEALSVAFEMLPIEVTLVLELNGARLDRVAITLDGEPVALDRDSQAQQWQFAVTEGRHEVTCAERGTDVTVQTITAVSGQTITLRCDPPALSRERELEWAIVGAGSAIAAAGLGMLVWYGVELDYGARTNQKVIQGFPKETVGGVLLGLGAVSALAGGLLLLDGASEPTVSSALGLSVTPQVFVSPDDWALGLSGRF